MFIFMKIRCFLEHNGNDSLLYAVDHPGAYTRGRSREEALLKMPAEIASWYLWQGLSVPEKAEAVITYEKESSLAIADADSDAIFPEEKLPLTMAEYLGLKALALRSAEDFLSLYESIPDKKKSCLPERKSFYGKVPQTAEEMYLHTKSVNSYYFAEIGVDADNEGDILSCRKRAFDLLEEKEDFLKNPVISGSYGEEWSLRKLLRRFVWHDRIHARAMQRMAEKTFGCCKNIFQFNR